MPTNSFPDDKSCLDLAVVFELDLGITHSSGNTPVDLGVKRFKVKVTGKCSLHLPTNLFPDDISCLG